MGMCVVDWGLIAAWVGATSTAGLLYAAIRGLSEWKSQFLRTRDHDLALRVIRSVTQSYFLLDALRTPHTLISDDPVPPPEADGPDPDFQYRKMFTRYRSRIRDLTEAIEERAALVEESMTLWGDNEYGVTLGNLIHELGVIESEVKNEASNYVQSLRPDLADADYRIDRDLLYSPAGAETPDATADRYESAKGLIFGHLGPKVRMT